MNKPQFTFFKNPSEEQDNNFRLVVLASFLSITAMIIIAAVVYFLTITPIDDTVVPRVVEKDLTEATLLLQENNLKLHITTQFHNSAPSGIVLKQSPSSGLRVKMDHTIDLVVSSGVPVGNIENFTGMTLDEVKNRLITVYRELLSLKEPLSYVYSGQQAGTIIAQNPPSGTVLSGTTQLELIISRGEAGLSQPISNYLGLTYEQALRLLGEVGLPFTFSLAGEIRGNGLILEQSPSSGEHLKQGQPINLTMARPENIPANQKVGLLTFIVPSSPITLSVRVLLRREGTVDAVLFTSNLSDATLTMPYVASSGDRLVVEIGGIENQPVLVE